MKRSKLLICSLGLREYDQFETAFAEYGCLTETADFKPTEIIDHINEYDGVIFSFDYYSYETSKALALKLSSYDNIKLVIAVTCFTDFDHSGIRCYGEKLVLLFRPLYMNKIMDMIVRLFPKLISPGCGDHSVRDLIDSTLHSIGYSITQTGYSALREGLLYMIENNCPSASLSREIYPYLEKQTGQSAAAIEKSIRFLNARIWRNASPGTVERFFPESKGFSDKGPGNKSVFAALVREINERLSE